MRLYTNILVKLQVIGVPAKIDNSEELADWLDAALIKDTWRPVRLDKGVHLDGEIEFS